MYEGVMSHIWMSHDTYMTVWCDTDTSIWVLQLELTDRRSHVTHMNESCHVYRLVMSHVWRSHVTHMNESWHIHDCVMYIGTSVWMLRLEPTDKGVMSHIWMSPVTYSNESCHTCEWVMSHIYMRHVTHINESCHAYGCVMRYRRTFTIDRP